MIACAEAGMAAVDDLCDGLAVHDVAGLQRGTVHRHALDDVAIVRLECEVDVSHQQLSVFRLTQGCGIRGKILGDRQSARGARVQDSGVFRHGESSVRPLQIAAAWFADDASVGEDRRAAQIRGDDLALELEPLEG